MTKATHKGTCQICGSTQKLPNGKLSKHGYTVKYGFFSGTCLGSNFSPIEVSFQRILQVIEMVNENIKVIKSQIEVLKNLNGDVAFFEGGEVIVTDEMVSTNRAKLPTHTRVNWLNVYGIHGSTKETIARSMNDREVKRLENRIKQMERYIEEKKTQVQNWQPRELIPLKKAA